MAVVYNGDTRTLLPPVLERQQAVTANFDRFIDRYTDSKNSAFLVQLFVNSHIF
jgi:hypothetical protein